MHLVVDIGNTETVVGVADPADGEIRAHWRLSSAVPRTADEYDHLMFGLMARRSLSPEDIQRCVMGSVVPSVAVGFQKGLRSLLNCPVFVVDPGTDLPIRLEVDEPQTVGADRIVNTLAAMELFRRDTVAVDLGTATTFDCISGDGVFLGGVIAPGVRAGLDWLGRRTAKLPRVAFKPPASVIGKRTETCMESGVFFSVVDSIDGVVDRIRAEWGSPDTLVVATGGYADLLAPHCRTVERVEPFLTLRGLFFAGSHMANGGGAGLDSPGRTEQQQGNAGS